MRAKSRWLAIMALCALLSACAGVRAPTAASIDAPSGQQPWCVIYRCSC